MGAPGTTETEWKVVGYTVYALNDKRGVNRFSASVQPGFTDAHEPVGHNELLANVHQMAASGALYDALAALFANYKELADSGDAGFWSIEDQPVGKQALAALALARGEQP